MVLDPFHDQMLLFVQRISNEILNDINTMSCPIKVYSNTIELTFHTSCYCVLDLLCVTNYYYYNLKSYIKIQRGNKKQTRMPLSSPNVTRAQA